MNSSKDVHREREERLQIALQRIWQFAKLFRPPSDLRNIPIHGHKIRRLHKLHTA